jgi:serine/threonine protein kinase HipA of HipAB toxin-antitoxin module
VQTRRPHLFSKEESRLLSCLISAPSQEVAAEWLGFTPTHLRRLLRELRKRLNVDTNEQLIVLALLHGAIDPQKVLPFKK